jgi:hypothetical protein
MKATDVYAYNYAKVGDKFLSFQVREIKEHVVIEVTPATVRLENGVLLSRITGKVAGYSAGALRFLPSYFPATKLNLERAERMRQGKTR